MNNSAVTLRATWCAAKDTAPSQPIRIVEMVKAPISNTYCEPVAIPSFTSDLIISQSNGNIPLKIEER